MNEANHLPLCLNFSWNLNFAGKNCEKNDTIKKIKKNMVLKVIKFYFF